jgi:hypothetical protein
MWQFDRGWQNLLAPRLASSIFHSTGQQASMEPWTVIGH